MANQNKKVDRSYRPLPQEATVSVKGVVDNVAHQKECGEGEGEQHKIPVQTPFSLLDEIEAGKQAQSRAGVETSIDPRQIGNIVTLACVSAIDQPEEKKSGQNGEP